MAAADRHRLFFVADWDVGFTISAHPPLPDVAPGESYVTEFVPQQPVLIYDVLVKEFAIVQIATGTDKHPSVIEQHGDRRLYRLAEPLAITPNDSVRVQLCNDSPRPLKQKTATILNLTLIREAAK